MIITVLVLVEIISAFETSMVYAAIPTFIREFHSDAATVGWAVTAFLLVAAASAAVCGRLGDMYGRERVLVVLLGAAAIGSFISAIGDSIGSIIVAAPSRAWRVRSCRCASGSPREHLPAKKVPVAIAIISVSAVAAGSASLLVAGVMLDHASWHMIFVVAAVYAVLALLLVLFVLPWRPPTGTTQKVDYLGTIAFAPAIAAVLPGFNKSGAWVVPTSDPRVYHGGLVSPGSVGVLWELR
ncbi:MFS transporter, partial [Rhodococcus hoagii]|nr:MFS transporter [Prescottella equi]